jgi:hypothetical protein
MALFWRLQGTTQLETHPSWDGIAEVLPDEPASPDWPGYWWAELADRRLHGEWFLIREADVERARAGDEVDIFVPGLYGCDCPADLLSYIESQVGGVSEDDGLYVALYEGKVQHRLHSDDGIIFTPLRLLEVTPAHEWVRQVRAELDKD